MKEIFVPIEKKALLTLEQAAAYTGIGINKLRDMSNYDDCEFILYNGNRRMFKREKLVEYLNAAYSIW